MARLLWGEDDIANSLTNLRKLVSRIKSRQSDLKTAFLTFDETDVHLERDSITSDIISARADTPKKPLDKLAFLAKGLRARFLGKANCQSRVFIDWRAGESRRHLAMLKETLDDVVTAPATPDGIALIKEAALLLFEAEPQDESTHRILLKAFDAEGGLEQLKRIFERRKELISSWPAKLSMQPQGQTPAPVHQSESGALSDRDATTRPIPRLPRLALLPPINHSPDPGAAMVATSFSAALLACSAIGSARRVRSVSRFFAIARAQTTPIATLWPPGLQTPRIFATTPVVALASSGGEHARKLLESDKCDVWTRELKEWLYDNQDDSSHRIAAFTLLVVEISLYRWSVMGGVLCALASVATVWLFPIEADLLMVLNLGLLVALGLSSGLVATSLERDEVLSSLLCNRKARRRFSTPLFMFIAAPFLAFSLALAIANVPGVVDWGGGLLQLLTALGVHP